MDIQNQAMNLLNRIIYGAKDLAERGGISPANSIHFVRIQLVAFSAYLFLPPVFFILFLYQISDEYIIYLCVLFALIIDSITGVLLKKVDLELHVSTSDKRKNIWVVNTLYLLMFLMTWLYFGVVAS